MDEDSSIKLPIDFDGTEFAGHLALPLWVQVQGVAAVLVSAEAYDGLLAASRRSVEVHSSSGAGPVSMAQLAAHAGSPIYLDHEVADFLYAEVGRLTIEQARTACRERFGDNRTPSRSAINRYWLRVRQGLDRQGAGCKE